MEFQSSIKEALAVHEGLRKVGFEAEDIYVRPQELQDGSILVHVSITNKDIEFGIAVGLFNGSRKELESQWEEASRWWNTRATDDQLDDIWENSKMRTAGEGIIEQLVRRGVEIPNLRNDGFVN